MDLTRLILLRSNKEKKIMNLLSARSYDKERGEPRRAVDLGSVGEENDKEILLVLEIGLRCTSEEERRPSMVEAVRALDGPTRGSGRKETRWGCWIGRCERADRRGGQSRWVRGRGISRSRK